MVEVARPTKERRPGLAIDDPLQYDAATVSGIARSKTPNSPVTSRTIVLVFPDLNTDNYTCKTVQRIANVLSAGPLPQGLRKSVNDLSRGVLMDDIVYIIALTAVRAKQMKG